MRNPRSTAKLLAVIATTTLIAAACGSSADTSSTGGESTGVEGEIFISGSSTVEPISIKVAESFEDIEPGVIVDVEGPGTGDGFKKFCAGESDISDASRQIKDAEAEACAAAGIEYIELRIGIDGIAVLTNPNNDIACLNFADLYAMVGPEAEGLKNWSDAATVAGELGSTTAFPDGELLITAPGAESGTYDSFIEIALEKMGEARAAEGAIAEDAAATTRTDYSSAADDNVIVTNIAADDTSFGWVGFAFADENADTVRAIPIAKDVDGPCVEATPETIASGEYPISRSLYIYVNKAKLDESPALAAYVDHYMTVGLDSLVSAADYVSLDDAAKAETRAAWDSK
ncbi:MAG: substrate-binding domain-containing protein [Acidimicrobiales bacterium]